MGRMREMGVVCLFRWPADNQSWYPSLGCPGHDLLPAQQRPELIGSSTAGMEGDYPLLWQTGSLPKARRELLRCRVQIDVGADIAWLADKTRDGL